MQDLRKFRSYSVHVSGATWTHRRNLQCGDDSILRANVTRDKGSPCLGAMGPRSGGSALLAVDFSVLVSILLCSVSTSGAALCTRLMEALRFRGSCP